MPVTEKKRRLNTLLALQERVGLARNEAWIGREVDVLVDAVTPPRSHDHEGVPAADGPGVALTGRTREHKLIHLGGDPALVGRIVAARVDHAGPYALRGIIVGA